MADVKIKSLTLGPYTAPPTGGGTTWGDLTTWGDPTVWWQIGDGPAEVTDVTTTVRTAPEQWAVRSAEPARTARSHDPWTVRSDA